MKPFLSVFLGLVLLLLAQSAGAGLPTQMDPVIVRPIDQTQLSLPQLIEELSANDTILLGERHYSLAVATAQGTIIRAVVANRKAEGQFTTAWEFLNFKEQHTVQTLFGQFVRSEITAKDFLMRTQGNPDAESYVPMLEATKALQGDLIGVNISHADKAPVVKGGIQAADPSLVPPQFEMGGAGYFERFAEAGHFPPQKLENYFAAQCLTDDIMAYHLDRDSQRALKFLVVGSFHTDFNDGTVARVKLRSSGKRVATVKILDASDYENPGQIWNELNHPKYGPIADYVLIVNEPKPLF